MDKNNNVLKHILEYCNDIPKIKEFCEKYIEPDKKEVE